MKENSNTKNYEKIKSIRFINGSEPDNERDSTLPSLDEYLENRSALEEPRDVRFAKIFGINVHVQSLAILQLISILLLFGVMFLNFGLNYKSSLFESLESDLPKVGWQGNIYINCILITPFILLMAWSYNFIRSLSTKILAEKYRKLARTLYLLGVFVFFIILIFHIFSSYGYLSSLVLMLILLTTPLIFGLIGILVKVRAYNIFAFLGIFFVCILHFNEPDEILELIFFAAILILYFDISDTTIRFSKISDDLWPGRDNADINLLNNTSAKYLINVFIVLCLTSIVLLILFNAQLFLSYILPREIVYSLEFKSAIFLIFILIVFAFLITMIKKFLPLVFRKSEPRDDEEL